jgi:hypothetical protein
MIFQNKDMLIEKNCTATSQRVGAWLFCALTLTKYGSPQLNHMTEIDFGNNFTHEVRISDSNSSTQSLVVKYRNQYEYSGDYDVYFNIPLLNYMKFVMTVPILGNSFIFYHSPRNKLNSE